MSDVIAYADTPYGSQADCRAPVCITTVGFATTNRNGTFVLMFAKLCNLTVQRYAS
jgi:hypothetical protein